MRHPHAFHTAGQYVDTQPLCAACPECVAELRSSHTAPPYVFLPDPKSPSLPFPKIRRIKLAEPRAATVLLLRDGLACCRRMSSRPYSNTGLHPVIALSLAQLIVKSCDDGDAPCGSLAEAEGMLREALPLAGTPKLWHAKAEIFKELAELLGKQGRHEEALRAIQEHEELLQVHETAVASGEEASGKDGSGDEESSSEESSGEDARSLKRRRVD